MRPSFEPTRPCNVEYLLRWVAHAHRILILFGVVRHLAVGTPVALVGAGGGVVDDHALVDVAVGDEDLVRLRLDVEVRGAAQVVGIVAALVHPGRADRQHVLAILGELHHVVAVARARPHEAVVIDIDAVLLVVPGVAVAGPAPRAQDLAVGIEFEDGWRGEAAVGNRRLHGGADFLRREARWHVDHPEVIAVVHEQAADVAEDPVVRQRRRPRGIDLVDRQPIGRG